MDSFELCSSLRRFLCLAFVAQVVFSVGAAYADDNPPIRLCQDSEDVYPWTLKSRPGLNDILLKIVETKTGQLFDIVSEPWQRCQEEMRVGSVDGMYAISFLPERLAFGVYPMRGNAPDIGKRLMTDGYSVFRRRGDSSVSWDGKTMTARGKIGAQRGYSIVSQLKGLNMDVDSGSYSVETNLRKLILGRIDAAALRTIEGDSVLVTNREFAGAIERLPIPLVEKPYYLMFSKQFVGKHEKLAHDIWDSIEHVRESPEYHAVEMSFR